MEWIIVSRLMMSLKMIRRGVLAAQQKGDQTCPDFIVRSDRSQ